MSGENANDTFLSRVFGNESENINSNKDHDTQRHSNAGSLISKDNNIINQTNSDSLPSHNSASMDRNYSGLQKLESEDEDESQNSQEYDTQSNSDNENSLRNNQGIDICLHDYPAHEKTKIHSTTEITSKNPNHHRNLKLIAFESDEDNEDELLSESLLDDFFTKKKSTKAKAESENTENIFNNNTAIDNDNRLIDDLDEALPVYQKQQEQTFAFQENENTMKEDLKNNSVLRRKQTSSTTARKNKLILPVYEDDEEYESNQSNKQQKQIQNNPSNLSRLSSKEKAFWNWVNVDDLDIFLSDLYQYYLLNGFLCIIIKRITDLLTVSFVIYFSTYLSFCIDYSKISSSNNTPKTFKDIQIPQCLLSRNLPPSVRLFFYGFYFTIAVKIFQFWFFELPKLFQMKGFVKYLLNVKEDELQTISWQLLVRKLTLLRNTNAVNSSLVNKKRQLSAHDIANRIMRKDNYLIAIYNSRENHDILQFRINYPVIKYFTSKNFLLTRTMDWNLQLCILGFVFSNPGGQFNPIFLKKSKRQQLINQLEKRFIICGIISVTLAPFLASYFIIKNFFKFFYEWKSNPELLGNKEFALFAQWRFREYNELYHFFKQRLSQAYNPATFYLSQFPNEPLRLVLKFIAFVSGALVTVLVLLTVLDPDLSINFEISKNKSVLFYIGILGSIWAFARSAIAMPLLPSNSSSTSNLLYTNSFSATGTAAGRTGTVSDIHNRMFDAEFYLREVSKYTHYLPKTWLGRYHSRQVRYEFMQMFQGKVVLMIKELLSIMFIPFVFWFGLPKCAPQIVDFFRDNTVYVDGLGYVCSFATFSEDNNKSNNNNADKRKKKKQNSLRESILDNNFSQASNNANSEGEYEDFGDTTGNERMLKSYLHFVESYSLEDNNKTHQRIIKKRNSLHKNLNQQLQMSIIPEESFLIDLTRSPKRSAKAKKSDNETAEGVFGLINKYYKENH